MEALGEGDGGHGSEEVLRGRWFDIEGVAEEGLSLACEVVIRLSDALP